VETAEKMEDKQTPRKSKWEDVEASEGECYEEMIRATISQINIGDIPHVTPYIFFSQLYFYNIQT
jgi:hypothetical protein